MVLLRFQLRKEFFQLKVHRPKPQDTKYLVFNHAQIYQSSMEQGSLRFRNKFF
jgi:hypothetical protein